MKPSETLDAAAALLVKDGWCQGWTTKGTGEHCLLGAMLIVAPPGEYKEAADYLRKVLHLGWAISDRPFRLTEWNDKTGRTKEQVLAKLAEAAELARKDGR